MPVPVLLATLSSVPLFASRPFLTAFLTALTARFGPALPWIGSLDVVEALAATPDWFRAPFFLVLLGSLAVLELAATRSSEARELLGGVERVVQAVVPMVVAFAWTHPGAGTAEAVTGGITSLANLWPVGVAAGSVAVGSVRRGALAWTGEVDPDSRLGLNSLRAFVEDVWVLTSFLFLVVFPALALVAMAAAVAALWAVRRVVRTREERRRVPCASCRTPIHAHALVCPHCRTEVAVPRAVGLFGQSLERPAAAREDHAFRLAFRHRCRVCASPSDARTIDRRCPVCGSVAFESSEDFTRYVRRIDTRVPGTLLTASLLGAVPLVGLVPALLVGHCALVTGVRGWVPALARWRTRWWIRLLHVLVLFLQPVPVVGALVMPLLCATSYGAWRSAALRSAEACPPVPAGSPVS